VILANIIQQAKSVANKTQISPHVILVKLIQEVKHVA
jgi:hypothetical protein